MRERWNQTLNLIRGANFTVCMRSLVGGRFEAVNDGIDRLPVISFPRPR
jgi:hypothetical protein